MILVLAANTGFTAFPMLAASMSKDKYMPRMFTVRMIVSVIQTRLLY